MAYATAGIAGIFDPGEFEKAGKLVDAEPVTNPDPMMVEPESAPALESEPELVAAAQALPLSAAGTGSGAERAIYSVFNVPRLGVTGSRSGLPDSIPTFLALFLILLTFFIGLTADASFDMSRVGAIVESVHARFAARGAAGSLVRASGNMGGFVAFGDRYARPADPVFADAFRAIFEPLAQDGAVIVDSADGRVFVELPHAMVFIPGTDAVRRDQGGVFEALASLLTGKDAPKDWRLAVTVLADDEVLSVTRAAAMGRWLARDPQVAGKVFVGAMPAVDAGLRFEIYRAGDAL